MEFFTFALRELQELIGGDTLGVLGIPSQKDEFESSPELYGNQF